MLTVAEHSKPTSASANSIHRESELNTGQDLPFFFQPKLSIGPADDPLEDEADLMADKVMRMQMPEPINFSSSKNIVNRKCTECEEEEKLQRKEFGNDSSTIAPPIVHNVLNSSTGRSLDADVRSFMEPRFNYDFGNVKVHDNDIAVKSASSINALAYTSGNNIVFNSGEYNTNTDSGKRLLAHELTHVVQQNGSGIQRQEDVTPVAPGNQAAKFIVADNMTPAAGQMRKSDFLERLNVEVCATVDETMQGTPFSSDNCPYVRAAFARHQNSSPLELEQVLERYEPSTRTAQSADDLIQRIKIRVASAASRWLQTGDLSDLPEEFRSQIPDGLGVVAGLFSSISSGIGSVVSGIGSIVSGIGSLFFKAYPGGAQPTQSPESVMQSLGKGNSMDGSTRVKMESAFGTSFSNVEVHTDNNAANLSSNMNARAFTVGNHVAFASGEHKPGTLVGDALMAHELAHVEQQGHTNSNDLHKKSEAEDSSLERDADNSAIGAVLFSRHGLESPTKNIRKNTYPKLRSGLGLQRCAHAAAPAKTLGTSPSFSLSGDWAKDVDTAKKTSNEMMMVTLAQQAVGSKIKIQPVGKSSIKEIVPEDFTEAPVVNFDINLNNGVRGRKGKIIGDNPGYSFNTKGKKYAVIGPKALNESSSLITKMVAEHELFHTEHHFDKGDKSLGDDQELETWTEDFIHYFHQFLSISKGRPVFTPLLDYYSTASDVAKKKSISKLKAYYDVPTDKEPEKVKDAISLWIYKWKEREAKNRKGDSVSKELIEELEKFVKPYKTK